MLNLQNKEFFKKCLFLTEISIIFTEKSVMFTKKGKFY